MHRSTTVVAATALACCLAGCGGGPKPKALPRDPPSPTPTATTPTPPAMPAAATANTKAGAEAFVRHYVDVFNYAQETGDTRPLAALAAPTCVSCRRVQAAIARVYRAGGHAEGGEWSVKTQAALRQPPDGWEVDTIGRFEPSDVYPTATSSARHGSGGRSVDTFSVHLSQREWRVTGWTRGS